MPPARHLDMMHPVSGPHVVFILSANYSGSHLLAQLLAAHPCCAGVGELHNYHKFRERGSRSGNVVNDYLEHPAFAGLDALPVTDWHATIWRRLAAEAPALTHLADNSKRPEWARRFPAANRSLIHLVRDPRALVARWLRTYDTAQARRQQWRRVVTRRPTALWFARDAIDTFIEKWLLSNRAISRFIEHQAPANSADPGRLVTYHDLARTPEQTLTALMPALGLHFDPEQLRYGSAGGQLGTRKRDYQDAARTSTIELDLRWRESLPAADAQRVAQHPGVRRYLAELGLSMTDIGLTGRT